MTVLDLAAARRVALTTYDAAGEPVTIPVWVVRLGDGRLGLPAVLGAVPRVRLQPCDSRGRPLEDAAPVEGEAEQVRSGGLFEETLGRLGEKYGWRARLPRRNRIDTVVLVTLDPSVPT